MTQNTLNSTLLAGGAVVYWKSASKSSKDAICSGLSALNLEQFEPEERSAPALLNAALGNVLSDMNAVVRPMAKRSGWHVFLEEKSETGNTLHEHGKAFTHGGDSFSAFSFDGKLADSVGDIKREFVSEAQWVSGTTVSKCLTDILRYLGGISLRQSGAVYWIPLDAKPVWEDVVKVFEGASQHAGDTMIHSLEVKFDPSAVRAVSEGVSEEIGTEIKEIHERLLADGLRNDTAEKLKKRLDFLLDKAKQYEQAIGGSLDAIRKAYDDALGTNALANLLRDSANQKKLDEAADGDA